MNLSAKLLMLLLVATACAACRHDESAATRTTRPSASGAASVSVANQNVSKPAANPGDSATSIMRFDSDPVGELANGFIAHAGRWQVVETPSARSAKGVLEQNAKSENDVFNIVLATQSKHDDVELSVALRALEGRVDQGGGVVWRARDAQNYYVARYNPLEDNLRVYYVKKGRRKMLESKTIRLEHQAWHVLRAKMIGDRIEVYLDDNKYLDVRDSTFAGAGAVGLWTKADARTQFDDLLVRAPKK